MESNPFKETKENNPLNLVGSIIEIDDDIKKFGGVQKYVLLKNQKGFLFATMPFHEHLQIRQQLEDRFENDLTNQGGGFLKFFEKEIVIGDSYSLKLGPLQIPRNQLQKMLQKEFGSTYSVDIE
ncbi:hypothetical protein H6776_01055 [Candidatus Nomurabacteria bacterium]|nr:hypothetical protein [Candidatus Nomurabacteria bacterium]